jgi:protein TonB
MVTLYRSILFSITLHTILMLFLINFRSDFFAREKPVVVDLTFTEPAIPLTGSPDGAASRPAQGRAGRRERPGTPLMQSGGLAGKAGPLKAVKPADSKPQELASNLPVGKVPVNPVPQPALTPEDGPFPGKQSPRVQHTVDSTGSASGNAGQAGGNSGSETGTGGAGGRGNGGNGADISQEQLRKKYLGENFSYIQYIIRKCLTYPRNALKEGWSGTVSVSFNVLESGQASDIRIMRSSGHEILDSNVVDTIRAASPFPRPPVRAELRMQIPFRLEE